MVLLADYMMIIQKVYPKFFTITANWDSKAIRNPEYIEYFNNRYNTIIVMKYLILFLLFYLYHSL